MLNVFIDKNTHQDYPSTVLTMERIVLAIQELRMSDLVWFLQYEPLLTKGTRAKDEHLLNHKTNYPIFSTGRGGEWTAHTPGQQVVYLLCNLDRKYDQLRDIKVFVGNLEQVIIDTLQEWGIDAMRVKGRVGIWVNINNEAKKIASLGIRVKKWVTMHGFALNVNSNLDIFREIVPCGFGDGEQVCSMSAVLGVKIDEKEVQDRLLANILKVFSYTSANLIDNLPV